MHDRARHESSNAESESAPEATAFGKTTLTEGIVPRLPIMRKAAGTAKTADGPGLADGLGSLGGGGRPLPADLAADYGQRMGADLSGVRVHEGPASQTAAEGLDARAFAVGQDIHFGAGESAAEPSLLAHEVVHTVQAHGSAGDAGPELKSNVSSPGDAAEVEADVAAEQLVNGSGPIRVQQVPMAGVHAKHHKKPKKHHKTAKAHDGSEATKDEGAGSMELLEQHDHDEAFLKIIAYYGADGSLAHSDAQPKKQPPQDDPKLEELSLDVLRVVWHYLSGGPGKTGDSKVHDGKLTTEDKLAFDQWIEVGARVSAVIARAESEGIEAEVLAPAKQAVKNLDRRLAARRADQMIDAEKPNVAMASPSSAYYVAAGKVLKKAQQEVGEAYATFKETFLDDAKGRAAGAMGERVSAAYATFTVGKKFWDLFGSDPDEAVEEGKKHGFIGAVDGIGELLSTLLELSKGVLESMIGLAKSVGTGAKATQSFEEFGKGLLKISEQAEDVATFLGGALAVLQVAMGLNDLIEAVRTGDEAGIVDSTAQIAMGGIGLLETYLTVTGPGGAAVEEAGLQAGVETGGGPLVALLADFYVLYMAFRDISAALVGIQEAELLKEVGAIVNHCSKVRTDAVDMAAAWQLMADKATASLGDKQSHDVYDQLKKKYYEHGAVVGAGLTQAWKLVEGGRELQRYSDVKDQLGSDAFSAFKNAKAYSDPLNPLSLFNVSTAFAGVNQMAGYAMKTYGPKLEKPKATEAPDRPQNLDETAAVGNKI